LIGGGVGIPPMVFLADALRAGDWQPLAILGSEIPFPFDLVTSAMPTPWVDGAIVSTMPLLETWGITTRLTSLAGFDGCYRGYVTDLAKLWLQDLSPEERSKVEVFACGPTPMLKAVAGIADEHGIAAELSMDEHMCCGVGVCLACVIRVRSADGWEYQRTCTEGPVFDSRTVAWEEMK
jgi:dihydroorotate dehydrogenase electron transfer subunit